MPVEQRQRQLAEAAPVDRALEAIARRPGGERHQEARVRPRRVQQRRRLEQEIAVQVELGGAAARQQREHRLREPQLQRLAGEPARAGHGRVLRHRVPDVGDRDAGAGVDRRLERKQRQHVIDGRRDPDHALGAPHPDRRADEMHGPQPSALEARLEPEIEIRRVDADEHGDALGDQPPGERPAHRDELGQPAEDLDEAAHRQRLQRIPGLAAGRLHPRTGDTDEADPGMARAHALDQRRRQRVARRLAGDDAEREGTRRNRRIRHPVARAPGSESANESTAQADCSAAHSLPPHLSTRVVSSVASLAPCAPPARDDLFTGSQRTMPRPAMSRKATSGARTGVSAAAATSRARASSSDRFSR